MKLQVFLTQTHLWKRRRGKKLSKPKRQNQSEENNIDSIRNPFYIKKENNIDRTIKDWIIRDIRKLFKTEKEQKKEKNRKKINYW